MDVDPPVVKLDTVSEVSALPSNVFAPDVTVMVYLVSAKKLSVGVKVAIVPVYVMSPEITVLPCRIIIVEELMDAGSIAILKVITIELFRAMPTALFSGLVELTEGVRSTSSSFEHAVNKKSVTANTDNSRIGLKYFMCYF